MRVFQYVIYHCGKEVEDGDLCGSDRIFETGLIVDTDLRTARDSLVRNSEVDVTNDFIDLVIKEF